MTKKIGRPAAKGKAVGLKPHLSSHALDLLGQQTNKSEFVAKLIEREAMKTPFNQDVIDCIQQAVQAMLTDGIDVTSRETAAPLVRDRNAESTAALNFRKYLKVIATGPNSAKIIPQNEATITAIGSDGPPPYMESWNYYIVSTPEGSIGLSHWFCEAQDYGIKVIEINQIPIYLLAKLAEAEAEV